MPRSWLLFPVAVVIAGCSASGTAKPDVESWDPVARAEGIETAVARGDRGTVDRLIDLLDADDPLMRLMAIHALQRLTGEDHGYRTTDPPGARAEAIDRWVAWRQETPDG